MVAAIWTNYELKVKTDERTFAFSLLILTDAPNLSVNATDFLSGYLTSVPYLTLNKVT